MAETVVGEAATSGRSRMLGRLEKAWWYWEIVVFGWILQMFFTMGSLIKSDGNADMVKH